MKLIVSFILAISLLSTSCSINCITGSGNNITKEYDISGFNAIKIGGSYDLILTQDSIYSVTIQGDDNIIERLEVEEINGTLRVKSKDNLCFNFKNNIILTVSAPNINTLETSGSARISSTNTLNVDNFSVSSSGSSKIDLNIQANEVETITSGSGSITFTGSANTFNVKVSGSGKVNAPDFAVNNCTVNTSGSANLVLNVSDKLDVRSSGSSKVRYVGSPVSVSQNISGSGSVKPLENQ